MKTTAVIIARGGSSRLPNKNLLEFFGNSLVAHKVLQLKRCQRIDEVVVGSDSDMILSAAECAGAKVIKRAPEFCDEKSRSWNEVIHNMVEQVDATTIVWAHCTNPCIQPGTYDWAIGRYHSADCDSLVSVTAFRSHIWWGGKPLNFDPRAETHTVAAKLAPVYYQNGGIFIARREDMIRWRYVYGKYPELLELGPDEAVDVDTQKDFERAVAIYPTLK